ncbi:MAG TPA: hypothetical protein VMT52_20300, partial [Planctomycetota bacterium]|nr:hypothetical protein [Planctomycetota bacterium]
MLTWRNAGLYDQVIVYRDGTSVASLPGTSTRFVDNDALEGVHTYEVRGGVFASSSVRVPVTCEVAPPPAGTPFRR